MQVEAGRTQQHQHQALVVSQVYMLEGVTFMLLVWVMCCRVKPVHSSNSHAALLLQVLLFQSIQHVCLPVKHSTPVLALS